MANGTISANERISAPTASSTSSSGEATNTVPPDPSGLTKRRETTRDPSPSAKPGEEARTVPSSATTRAT